MNTFSPTSLFDLVRFDWDYKRKKFLKTSTILYNQPKALCYGKKKIEMALNAQYLTKYKVVPNGTYQYSNQFNQTKVKQNEQVHRKTLC